MKKVVQVSKSHVKKFRQATLSVTYQSVLLPLNALLLVGIGVCVTLNGTGVTAEKTVQGRANLVAATSLDSVALSATGLEQTSTLLCVT